MADDVLASFLVALGFQVDTASQTRAKKTLEDYEKAVIDADARVAKARADNAKAAIQLGARKEAAQAREALFAARAAMAIVEREKEKTREQERGADKFAEVEKKKNKAQAEATAFAIAKYQLLITAIQDAARAAASALTTSVTSFNQLYYVSARTGSSVASLKAFGYAAEQTGGSFAAAIASVESFSQAMRTNPGVKSYVEDHLKVDKNLGDAEKMQQAIERLNAEHKNNPYVAQAWATQNLGISLEEYNRLTKYGEEAKKQAAERKAFYQSIGVDEQKAAEDSKRFSQAIGSVTMMVGGLRDKLVIALIPAVEGLVKRFSEWIRNNPREIDRIITAIATGIDEFAKSAAKVEWEKLFKGLVDFVKGVNDAVQAMGGWKTVAEAVFALWIGDKVIKVLASIAAIRSALVLGEGSLLAALLRVAAPIAIGAAATGHGYQTPEQAAKDPEQAELQREGIERRGRVREAIGGAWRGVKRFFGGGGADAAEGGASIRGRTARPGHVGKLAQSENAKAIIDELKKAGLPDEGVAAAIGSMQTESSLNPAVPENNYNRGHHGLIQWDSTRWPKVEKWIKDQGGDPYDARWQTRAFVAEGRAKPGDALYDSAATARGFKALEESHGNLEKAVTGMRGIERFGPGEEGGRGVNAQSWLRQINGTAGQTSQSTSNVPPVNGVGGLDQKQGGAQHRPEPISDVLQRQLVAAGMTAGVNAEVFSGGQDPDHQYGSTRHNHGNAADLKLYRMEDGKKRYLSMLNDADRAVMEKFVRASVAAGATGVGAHPNYMGPEGIHVGGGAPAAWGNDRTSATAPDWLTRAHRQGMEDRAAGRAAESVKAAAQAVKAAASGIVPPKPAPASQAASASPPPVAAEQKDRPIVVPPMNPSGFDPNRIDPRDLMKPAAPLGVSPVTNDNSSTSKSVTQNITNNVKVDGSGSPREHGRIMESSLSRVHGLALANVQSAVA